MDVIVNSTNTNLDLKQGILSRKLLVNCGSNLQKACSSFAPLRAGDVAVTDANNLPCKLIFHVALVDYKIKDSEKVCYDTAMQATNLHARLYNGVSLI